MHITKIDMTCPTCFTKIKLWTTIQLKKFYFVAIGVNCSKLV